MNKRVFIFANERFPRGSAGANYIEYLALAIQSSGIKVVVLGKGENYKGNSKDGIFCYNSIEYYNDSRKLSKIRGVFDNRKHFEEVFDRYKIQRDEYFLLYSIEYQLFRRIAKKVDNNHVSVIRVEDYQSFQYKYRSLSPNYISYKLALMYARKKFKKFIPISRLISEKEERNGSKCLCLPIMANPYEFGYSVRSMDEEVVRFVYPGMKVTTYEDDIKLMFESLAIAERLCKKRLELHITGITKDKFERSLQAYHVNKEKMPKNVVMHEWMEYDDLIELYKSMDYLILARKDNAVTRANFPSKVPELMSFGVVPVCTDVGDYTKYYLENTINSIIYKPDSVKSCIEAIVRAAQLDNTQYQNLRMNARSLVEKKFYYGNWAKKIVEFILEEKQ